jgi:hypothetical protein
LRSAAAQPAPPRPRPEAASRPGLRPSWRAELIKTPTYNALDCGGGTFISLQTQADIDLETFRTSPDAVEWARTPSEPAGTIEHFCLEVDDFDLEQTRADLRAEGHETVEISGNLLTADPDGVLVQIVDSGLEFLHEQADT